MKLFRRDDTGWDFGPFGWHTIYGWDGIFDGIAWTRFMDRLRIGRLYLHVFHRGDNDPDPHDHPWDFWTFPLTSYVEEVADPQLARLVHDLAPAGGIEADGGTTYLEVVKAFRWHHRPAEYTHRVLGRYAGEAVVLMPSEPVEGKLTKEPSWRLGKIVTLCWKSRKRRQWGFLKDRGGRFSWVPWRTYINDPKGKL